jgi:hypothetical protein
MTMTIHATNIAVFERQISQFHNYSGSANVILHAGSLYASTEPLSPGWDLGPSARALGSELLRDNVKTQPNAL